VLRWSAGRRGGELGRRRLGCSASGRRTGGQGCSDGSRSWLGRLRGPGADAGGRGR
jgi:hypothetical protein